MSLVRLAHQREKIRPQETAPENSSPELSDSLAEIKELEQVRITQERTAAEVARSAEKQRRLEAERQAREEQARQQRLAEEAKQREIEEKERLLREERLRLQEAEQRCRIEAEMKLQQQRQSLEVREKMQAEQRGRHKQHIAALIFLSVIAAGLGFVAYRASRQSELLRASLEEQRRSAKEAIKFTEDKLMDCQSHLENENVKTAELRGKMAVVKSEAERQAIRRQLEAQAEERARSLRLKQNQKAATLKRMSKIRIGACTPNDPLCGIE